MKLRMQTGPSDDAKPTESNKRPKVYLWDPSLKLLQTNCLFIQQKLAMGINKHFFFVNMNMVFLLSRQNIKKAKSAGIYLSICVSLFKGKSHIANNRNGFTHNVNGGEAASAVSCGLVRYRMSNAR